MKKVTQYIRNAEWFTMSVAVMAGVLFVFSVAQAATTISTDVTTGGNIYATSTIQATGAITGYSTLAITGASTFTGDATFGHASTTQITNSGISWLNGNVIVNGYATTTASNGNFATQGTLTVVGTSNHTGDATFGHASTTQITNSGTAWFGSNVNMNGSAPTLTLTTTGGATSTAIVGCIQTYATSSATPIKLIMGSPNASASTTMTSTAVAGFMVWAYGSCPSF